MGNYNGGFGLRLLKNLNDGRVLHLHVGLPDYICKKPNN